MKCSVTLKPMKLPALEDIKNPESIALLKELHILTRDGKINQDSRRKLKQVYHLYQFIEPLLSELKNSNQNLTLVDHGAGKSYLGFILYDLFYKNLGAEQLQNAHVYGIETRDTLIQKSLELQKKLGFEKMTFLNMSVTDSISAKPLPTEVGIVTALHACDTATDDALDFALSKKARFVVVVPCCQAEVAQHLRENKIHQKNQPLYEVFRHPLHTREFGSHLTNVLRCLRLESYGYKVTVTELVGHEHSMKNELILAEKIQKNKLQPAERLQNLLHEFGLEKLQNRFNPAW